MNEAEKSKNQLSAWAQYVLYADKNWFMRAVTRPFQNALKNGANQSEEDYKRVRKLYFIGAGLFLVFLINAFLDEDKLVHILFVLIFAFGIPIIYTLRYGYRHRDLIDASSMTYKSVADAGASAGLYAVVGAGLWGLVEYLFGG